MVSEAERHLLFAGIACLVLAGAVVASLYTAAELMIGLRRHGSGPSEGTTSCDRRRLDMIMSAVMVVLAAVCSAWLAALVASALRQLRS